MTDEAPAQPKVLLVDDSRMIRASAEKMLSGSVDLLVAESGEQAWALLTAEPSILAVFTDVSMPGLDGYGLLQRIRTDERPGINQLPVIIVTGDDEDGAREQALSQGATDFIKKPFDRSELLARANGYATQDRLRRHIETLEASRQQDTVTGLGTGRYLGARLKSARAHALRHGHSMAVVQIALTGMDPLKRDHGADAVQRVLREAGQALSMRMRGEDVLARVGEARFAAVCPNCDAEGAKQVAQRLVEGVRSAGLGAEGAAIGAAAGAHVPDLAADPPLRAVYDAARAALTQAMSSGEEAAVRVTSGTGDGSTVAPATAESARGRPASADSGSSAEGTTGRAPSLDEALEMLSQPDGAERLAPYIETLLERCAALFDAAPPEVSARMADRLRDRAARRAS